MTDIDYEALAKAHYISGKKLVGMTTDMLWDGANQWTKAQSLHRSRAVVAALRDQGFVVAPRDDVRQVSLYVRNGLIPSSIRQSAERLSALAAPGDGGDD